MHEMSGYVELGYNSRNHVRDIAAYVVLFVQFDRHLRKGRFASPTMFIWELVGATFVQQRFDGFVCTIYVRSQLERTPELAMSGRNAGLLQLRDFLATVPPFPDSLF